MTVYSSKIVAKPKIKNFDLDWYKEQFEKIIKHQVNMGLREKGLSEKDLTHFEYLKLKYEVAIKLLCEL